MGSGVDIEYSGPYGVFVVYLSLMKVPKEIFDKWEFEWWETVEPGGECDGYEFFANKAAEWAYKKGADDELEACCNWEEVHANTKFDPITSRVEALRYARRGQPISLKQQAINDLELARTVESLPDFDLILAALNTIPGK